MSNHLPLLEIKNLKTYFELDSGTVRAVDGVSFSISHGETLGVIGESGCGKSVTAHSILRLIPSPPGRIVDGEILFRRDKQKDDALDLAKLHPKKEQIRHIRGNDISMIFQEPMTSFGPLHTIGNQIMEAIEMHQTELSKEQRRKRTVELLEMVGIPNAEQRVNAYPHEFSGGMRQRAMIAMALSCSPYLLIADEPTTSLDVTIEAQILELLQDLQDQQSMSIMLITHNLAVVSEMSDYISVMYLGKVAEFAETDRILDNPLHPYTKGLWRSIPQIEGEITPLVPIKGSVPGPHDIPTGCVFASRCEQFMEGICDRPQAVPNYEVEPGHFVACYLYDEDVEGGRVDEQSTTASD